MPEPQPQQGQPLSDEHLSALIKTGRIRQVWDNLTDEELYRVARLSRRMVTGGGVVSAEAQDRLANLEGPFEAPPASGPGFAATVERPSRTLNALLQAGAEIDKFPTVQFVSEMLGGVWKKAKEGATGQNQQAKMIASGIGAAISTVEAAKFATKAIYSPGSIEQVEAGLFVKNFGSALKESPHGKFVRAFQTDTGLEELAREQPEATAEVIVDALTLGVAAARAPAVVGRLLRSGKSASEIAKGLKTAEELAAGIKATEQTLDTVADARGIAAAAGKTDEAAELASRERLLAAQKDDLLERIRPTTEKQLDELKAAEPAVVESPISPVERKIPQAFGAARAKRRSARQADLATELGRDREAASAVISGLAARVEQSGLPEAARSTVMRKVDRLRKPGVQLASPKVLAREIAAAEDALEDAQRAFRESRKLTGLRLQSVSRGTQAGEIDRALLTRLGGSALGAGMAEGVRQVTGADENGFSVGDGLFLVGGALAGWRFADPAFRAALADFATISQPRIRGLLKAGPAGDPSAERLFQTFIEPLLPEKITGEFLAPAFQAGATVGGGLVGGFGADEDGFSPRGAVMGAGFGFMLGSRFLGNPDAAVKLFPKGFNAKQAYRRLFLEDAGLPPEVAAMKIKLRDRMSGRAGEIFDTARILAIASKNDPALGEQIDLAMRGRIAWEAIPDEKVRNAARTARYLFDELATDLVRVGLAEGQVAETILTNRGSYMPRLYMFWEDADHLGDAARWLRSHDEGLSRFSSMDYLKGRENIPESVRKAWGEIVNNPGYLLGKRGVVTNADIAFADYAKFIGSSQDFSLLDAQVTVGRQAIKAGLPTDLKLFTREGAEMAELGGKTYRKLGSNPKLGAFLKNRYVLDTIADDMETMIEVPQGIWRFLQRGTAFFKGAKVTLNPATLMRNVFGNIIMADMGGLSPANLSTYKRAWNDYRNSTGRYLEARRAGLFGGEYFGTEIRDLLRATEAGEARTTVGGAFQWLGHVSQKPLDKLGRFHEASEQFWKQAMFNYARDTLHMDTAEAVRYAKRYIFDYREVPRWVQVTRKSIFGAPFISFSYKAMPRVAENALAIGDPAKAWRFWKYPIAMGAVNEYSARKFGITESDQRGVLPTLQRIVGTGLGFSWGEFGKIKGMMPSYTGAQQVLLPFLDQGRLNFFDATWTLPWGDFGELGKGQVGKALGKAGILFPRQLEPSNPWLQMVAAGLTGGKDPFTGKDIVSPEATSAVAGMDILRYIARQFGPALTPGAGFSARKLERSFSGDFETDPNVPTPGIAVASELGGVKMRALDPQMALSGKKKELETRIEDAMPTLFKVMRGLKPDQQKTILAFADDEIPLSQVPKALRGKARRFKRVRDSLQKAGEELQESIPASLRGTP